jgi:DNA polymerase-1
MERIVITTLEELDNFLQDFNKKVFAFDTETTSLKYDLLEINGFSLCDGVKSCYVKLNHQRELAKFFLNRIFPHNTNGKDLLIIAHNIVFDAKVLAKYGFSIHNAEWV